MRFEQCICQVLTSSLFALEQRSAEESGQGDVETGAAGPTDGHQPADVPRSLGSIHQLTEYVRSWTSTLLSKHHEAFSASAA